VQPTGDADLAGMGKDCPFNGGGAPNVQVNCINGPRIDAQTQNGCVWVQGISGVVCCKN
jgi:hypothetical protein